MVLQIFLTRSETSVCKFISARLVDKDTKTTETNKMQLIEQEAIVVLNFYGLCCSVVYWKCLFIHSDAVLKCREKVTKSNAGKEL